jgi:LysR family cys regulon transcriptional activator
VSPLTLEAIARWPLITYRQGITGRSRIDEAFNRKGLMPDIVLSARIPMSSRPTSSWGWASGWSPSSPGMPAKRTPLRVDTRHLFDANTVWLGLKRGQLQRNYVWRFIELCNAGLSLDEIKRQAMEPEEAAIDYQI